MKHADDVEHLAGCAKCRQRFAGKAILADSGERLARKREFVAAAVRLERERNEAADVVARHLRETPIAEWPRLAELPSLRNNAALEQMSEEVRKRLHRRPTEALTIAQLSTAVADSITAGLYPPLVLAQIRANAWKDRASALRYLSRFDEALDAVFSAEAHLAPFSAVEHDRAIIQMVKGLVLLQTGRGEEALSILATCRRVFAEHHDHRRRVHSGIGEGNALYEMSRYEDARRIFASILDDANATNDIESRARIHNNLGYCMTQLGDYVQANIHFSEAIAKFNDLGFTAEVPRTERGAGRVLIARGQTAAGLAYLRAARRDFTAAGVIEDAGLCALSIAALLVERGEGAEARILTQEVIDEFTAAALDERTIAAVVRLRDAIDVEGATAETVRTIHAFVESLHDDACCVAN